MLMTNTLNYAFGKMEKHIKLFDEQDVISPGPYADLVEDLRLFVLVAADLALAREMSEGATTEMSKPTENTESVKADLSDDSDGKPGQYL